MMHALPIIWKRTRITREVALVGLNFSRFFVTVLSSSGGRARKGRGDYFENPRDARKTTGALPETEKRMPEIGSECCYVAAAVAHRSF